jgi:hypothetical protein
MLTHYDRIWRYGNAMRGQGSGTGGAYFDDVLSRDQVERALADCEAWLDLFQSLGVADPHSPGHRLWTQRAARYQWALENWPD